MLCNHKQERHDHTGTALAEIYLSHIISIYHTPDVAD
jgi:hypothetical protein